MDASFTLGPFTVDANKNVLERQGHRVRIEPKAMRVLVLLAARAGEDVPKEEILRVVWEDSSVRTDVLTNVIWELRKALGDDCREPDFIQTVPRKGYRLVAPVARKETVSTWKRALGAALRPLGRSPFLDGKRDALLRLLRSRFGGLPDDLEAAVSSLDSSEDIDRVIDAALGARSFDEVRRSLGR